MPLLSLDNLSVVGVSPSEFVDVAADAGFDAISPFAGGSKRVDAHRLAIGDEATETMIRRLKARGLIVNALDGMVVKPRMDWDEYARLIETGLHIGAQRGITLIFDMDRARAEDSFCRLSEMCANAGFPLAMEFGRLTGTPSLAAAAAFVSLSDHPVGLLIDLLHLIQGGETPADIARVDPALIVAAQLCDGSALLDDERYMYEALHERSLPGDGELPVVAFLKALPPHAAIGLEVPMTSLVEGGVSHRERARLLHDRARALLMEAGLG